MDFPFNLETEGFDPNGTRSEDHADGDQDNESFEHNSSFLWVHYRRRFLCEKRESVYLMDPLLNLLRVPQIEQGIRQFCLVVVRNVLQDEPTMNTANECPHDAPFGRVHYRRGNNCDPCANFSPEKKRGGAITIPRRIAFAYSLILLGIFLLIIGVVFSANPCPRALCSDAYYSRSPCRA